jgi:hypothetical protein
MSGCSSRNGVARKRGILFSSRQKTPFVKTFLSKLLFIYENVLMFLECISHSVLLMSTLRRLRAYPSQPQPQPQTRMP